MPSDRHGGLNSASIASPPPTYRINFPVQASKFISEPPSSPPLTSLISPFPIFPISGIKLETYPFLPSTADSTALSILDTKATEQRVVKPPKNHVKSACQYCKGKHLKCEEARPCKRCVDEGRPHDCIDVPPKKRGRPPLEANGGGRRGASLALNQVSAPTIGLMTPSHALQPNLSYQSVFHQGPQAQYLNYPQQQQYALPLQSSTGYPMLSSSYGTLATQPPIYASPIPPQPQVLLTTELRVVRVNPAFQALFPSASRWPGHSLPELVRLQDAHITGQLQQMFLVERSRLSPRRHTPSQAEDVIIAGLAEGEIDRSTNYRPSQTQTLSFEDPHTSTLYSLPLQFSLGVAEVPFVAMTLFAQQPHMMIPSHHSNMVHANPPHIITQSQHYRSPSSMYAQPTAASILSQQHASYFPRVRQSFSTTANEPLAHQMSTRPTYNHSELQSLPSQPLRLPHSSSYRQEQPVAQQLSMPSMTIYSVAEAYPSGAGIYAPYQPQAMYPQNLSQVPASLLPSPERMHQSTLPSRKSPVTPQKEVLSNMQLPPLRPLLAVEEPSMRTSQYEGFDTVRAGKTRKREESRSSPSNEEEEDNGDSGDDRPRKRLRMGIQDITG